MGKEILLKTMIQVVPTKTMSAFFLPMKLCKEMEGLMNIYWWCGGGREKNCIFLEGMGRVVQIDRS